MTLSIIALFVLGYFVVLAFAISLLRTAKRADTCAHREHDAFLRSTVPRTAPRLAAREDRRLTLVRQRRSW